MIVENYLIYSGDTLLLIMSTLRKAKNYVKKSTIKGLQIWRDVGYSGGGGGISLERIY